VRPALLIFADTAPALGVVAASIAGHTFDPATILELV
jgi:hypothetical protein